MQAYLNDEKLKVKMVKEMKLHMKMDKVIQGTYESDKGYCAVGCALDSLNHINKKESSHSDHSRYETELGIPRTIARLEDRIFEGLSNEEAKEFPLKFIQSVNVGADLSMVMPKFFVWLLGDKEDGVINFAKGYKKTEKAIKGVLKLYQETVGGKIVKKERWVTAKNAVYDVAYDAATAYAAAAATATAYDAATAYAATAYAADARRKHYSKMAKKLLEILAETK